MSHGVLAYQPALNSLVLPIRMVDVDLLSDGVYALMYKVATIPAHLVNVLFSLQ
ncbi:MAG: hypothetical protein GX348_11870 [Veillonellaceae bacterium]|jgi:hypothetical protein|nr:hypothetical protein [Veillonellaceae bacterium]